MHDHEQVLYNYYTLGTQGTLPVLPNYNFTQALTVRSMFTNAYVMCIVTTMKEV